METNPEAHSPCVKCNFLRRTDPVARCVRSTIDDTLAELTHQFDLGPATWVDYISTRPDATWCGGSHLNAWFDGDGTDPRHHYLVTITHTLAGGITGALSCATRRPINDGVMFDYSVLVSV